MPEIGLLDSFRDPQLATIGMIDQIHKKVDDSHKFLLVNRHSSIQQVQAATARTDDFHS